MEVSFPTWRDVDAPVAMLKYIKSARAVGLLSFLLHDRVFRVENKVHYTYHCDECGFPKIITRQYEEYSICEKCGSNKVRGVPFWKDGYHSSKTSLDVNAVVEQMESNYTSYLGEVAEEIVAKEVLKIDYTEGRFSAQFISGDVVRDSTPSFAIAKAAILVPFLWDSRFNWRDNIHNDRGCDLHITHLIMQWRCDS